MCLTILKARRPRGQALLSHIYLQGELCDFWQRPCINGHRHKAPFTELRQRWREACEQRPRTISNLVLLIGRPRSRGLAALLSLAVRYGLRGHFKRYTYIHMTDKGIRTRKLSFLFLYRITISTQWRYFYWRSFVKSAITPIHATLSTLWMATIARLLPYLPHFKMAESKQSVKNHSLSLRIDRFYVFISLKKILLFFAVA